YDEKDTTASGYNKLERMIVFGGVHSDASTPSDTVVWELRFDPTDYTVATWYQRAWVNADTTSQVRRPAARAGHAMVWDGGTRRFNPYANGGVGKYGHVGFMYGGKLADGSYSDELWLLWLFEDGSAGWQKKSIGGNAPGARAGHSLILDPREGLAPSGVVGARLYVFGGNGTDTTVADSSVHVVDP